jgi:hypothetical protein
MSIQILRGQIPNDETIRIYLFDGTNTTGYRILRFDVAGSNWGVDPDVFGVVATEDLGIDARTWNWGDNREKAWAAQSYNGGGSTGEYFSRHVDDVIVEDLFIHTISPNTNQAINYMLVLEKIKIPAYEAALARVSNASQG